MEKKGKKREEQKRERGRIDVVERRDEEGQGGLEQQEQEQERQGGWRR